jgi:hypothetical protein
MPDAKPLVDTVRSLSSSLAEVREAQKTQRVPETISVNFQSGPSGLLDMKQPRSAIWAEVLHSMREANQPAYVEIDPETKVITELLVPIQVRVGEIRETKFGAEVDLIISHARHYLRRARPDFRRLREVLETARKEKSTVLVTETDDHHVIDVRSAGQLGAGDSR